MIKQSLHTKKNEIEIIFAITCEMDNIFTILSLFNGFSRDMVFFINTKI
jgi:hypothetical protein